MKIEDLSEADRKAIMEYAMRVEQARVVHSLELMLCGCDTLADFNNCIAEYRGKIAAFDRVVFQGFGLITRIIVDHIGTKRPGTSMVTQKMTVDDLFNI